MPELLAHATRNTQREELQRVIEERFVQCLEPFRCHCVISK